MRVTEKIRTFAAEKKEGNMHDDSMPLWAWILFYVLVFIMLLIDLKSFASGHGFYSMY